MRTIIAGSRTVKNPSLVEQAISEASFVITEVVSGCAPGVDTLGERWARLNNIPIKPFPAEWDNLTQPGAIVKRNRFGKPYNFNAGFYRNTLMANYAEALIALWDSGSGGTKDMIDKATAKNLDLFVLVIENGKVRSRISQRGAIQTPTQAAALRNNI